MRMIINIITGFLIGITPLLVAFIFGVIIYNALPNIFGSFLIIILGVLALWLGVIIFKKIQLIGPIEFFTLNSASPDLDNLELDPNSGTKRRQPIELTELIEKNKNLCGGGRIRIYGKWLNKSFGKNQKIINSSFDRILKVLTINFEDGKAIEIRNPKQIFEASTFLKINESDEIRWTWKRDRELTSKCSFVTYKRIFDKIETDSNSIDFKPRSFTYPGIRYPAIMIYG